MNNVKTPVQNTGPAKPARTYKSLQRSKSFNVHGLNGTADPSPIYIEKLTNNNYKNLPNGGGYKDYTPSSVTTTTEHTTRTIYKSTPHLSDSPIEVKLKSPSIVNLISRSTRDLSQLNGHDHLSSYIDRRYNSPIYRNGTPDKKSPFLKGLSEEEEDKGKNIKFSERETNSTSTKTSSRSSPVINGKDPIGILRRGSNSTDNENYSETYKYQTKSNDPLNPTVTNTTETFTKKTIPANGTAIVHLKDGKPMKKETVVETHEIKKITSSRNYTPSPTGTNLKYFDLTSTPINKYNQNGNGGVVIELKNNY